MADALELPIERGIAGPGMLADTIVRRWQDHQPLDRLEGIYARDGLELSKSTICTWHEQLADWSSHWWTPCSPYIVTQQLIDALERGTVPWRKEWDSEERSRYRATSAAENLIKASTSSSSRWPENGSLCPTG